MLAKEFATEYMKLKTVNKLPKGSKRKGKKKALVAIARKILVAAFFVMKRMEPYKEPAVKQQDKARQIKHHLQKLTELGVSIEAA